MGDSPPADPPVPRDTLNGHSEYVEEWAARFAMLGDPSRLGLLLMIERRGPISVTDLATASGMSATAVSHSLRLLKLHDMIRAERVGHFVRYRIDPGRSGALLDQIRRRPP